VCDATFREPSLVASPFYASCTVFDVQVRCPCTRRSLSPSSCHGWITGMLCWEAYRATCTTICSRCSKLPAATCSIASLWRSDHMICNTLSSFHLVNSPRACSVQAGDSRVLITDWHGTILPCCRPSTVVWNAVEATSAVITDPSAGYLPVTVCNCCK